jgi:hypothetical protein
MHAFDAASRLRMKAAAEDASLGAKLSQAGIKTRQFH